QAVLNSCRYLERFGLTVTYLPVDQYALVSPEQVASALTEQTAMVSLTYVNNEVGSILNVEDIVRAIRERERALGHRIAVHLDAVQAPGYAPLDVRTLGVDIMSLSGHKFGGPVGTGVLYVRRATPFLPLIDGGVQERRRRAGTENVAGAVGLATALGLVTSERPTVEPRIRRLRDRLIERITAGLPGAKLNGHPTERAANNVNFSFAGLDGESLVLALDAQGVACSAGSACAHTTWEPSHVLLAMGCTLEEATGALRLTLGNPTTDQDIDDAGRIIVDVVRRLLSDAYTLPSQGSEWAPPTEGEASPHGSAARLP
ncbi:MAG TPA: cysteine desulfurase family protein, partial [Dehalococcoidia bacterium]|nr:cysteine desulfurase family protein [Dehalococcoidia bacterium]